MESYLRRDLTKRLRRQRATAIVVSKASMNESELKVHNRLLSLGLNPTGKIIVENKYGTYNEVDNSFEFGGKRYFVMVTESKSDYMEVLAGHAKQHAGQAFFIKRCYPDCDILSIILSKKNDIGNSRGVKYLKENTILITSLDNLKDVISGLSN